MLVEGLKGSFFELSGGAFYRYEGGAENYVILPKTIFWNGTIILMKIPVNAPDEFDYHKYLE